MPTDTNATRGTGGVQTIESTPKGSRRGGRSSTYTYEFGQLETRGELTDLSRSARRVLGHLAHLADHYGRDNPFRRHEQLANALDCSTRTVIRGLNELRAEGWVHDRHVYGRAGQRVHTEYRLGGAFSDGCRWGLA